MATKNLGIFEFLEFLKVVAYDIVIFLSFGNVALKATKPLALIYTEYHFWSISGFRSVDWHWALIERVLILVTDWFPFNWEGEIGGNGRFNRFSNRWISHRLFEFWDHIQSPLKVSIPFCQAKYEKLRGAWWKLGGAPYTPPTFPLVPLALEYLPLMQVYTFFS